MLARTVRTVAALGIAGLALTACSSSPAKSAQPAPAPSAASAGAGTSAPAPTGGRSATGAAAATTVAAPATSAAASDGSTSPSGSLLPTCRTDGLQGSITNVSPGAGQVYATLVLTNTTDHPCALTGFPGVAFLPAAGATHTVGNPADRQGTTYSIVTLKPHGSAHAVVHDSNGVGGYDPAQCQLTPVAGLQVYPPGSYTALFVPWKTDHCAGSTIHALTIGPVTQ
jgi:hypothetical protein